jgi:hypothetical protein
VTLLLCDCNESVDARGEWIHPAATIQGLAMVHVTFIASSADVVVDSHVQSLSELQGEVVNGGEVIG